MVTVVVMPVVTVVVVTVMAVVMVPVMAVMTAVVAAVMAAAPTVTAMTLTGGGISGRKCGQAERQRGSQSEQDFASEHDWIPLNFGPPERSGPFAYWSDPTQGRFKRFDFRGPFGHLNHIDGFPAGLPRLARPAAIVLVTS